MILAKLLLTALLAANMKLCAAIAAALTLLPTVALNAVLLGLIKMMEINFSSSEAKRTLVSARRTSLDDKLW